MIFLGLLSFIQLTILPGWLITWRWRSPSWLARVLSAFGLSLLFNHLLVLLLVVLGWFSRPVVLGMIGIELLLLLWLLYCSHWTLVPKSAALSFSVDLSGDKLIAPRWLGVGLFWVIVLVALSAFMTVVIKVLSVNPGVFNLWDDFISFNRWAVDWYNGIVPIKTQWYPQLIPTNWAFSYHIIGNSDIQFFVKAVMGIFPIAILLIFIDLFYRYRRVAFLLGLFFTTILLLALANPFIGSGYVDIPTAFLVFLAGSMLIPELFEKRLINSHLIVACILAATAALTKQGGLFIILPLMVWSGILVFAQQKRLLPVLKWSVGLILMFIVLISPWYGYKLWQMNRGIDAPEIVSVENALIRSVGERSLIGRWSYGANMAATRLSGQLLKSARLAIVDKNNRLVWNLSRQPISSTVMYVMFLFLAILLIMAVITPVSGVVFLTMTLPFFLIWAAKYSYDLRNLTPALPFLGMGLGFGLIRLLQFIFGKSADCRSDDHGRWEIKVSNLPYISLIAAAIIVAIIGYWQVAYPTPSLYAMQEEKMRSIGTESLNERLYTYYEQHGLTGKIRSMYQPLNYLPKLKDYSISTGDLLTVPLLEQIDADSDIHYILWWKSTTQPEALPYINERLVQNKYTGIFDESGYFFIKVKP